MALSEADVLAEIQKIVAAQLDFKGEVVPDDELIADLELDSLALAALAVAVEDHCKLACELLAFFTPQRSIQVKRRDRRKIAFPRGRQEAEHRTSRSIAAEGVFGSCGLRFRFSRLGAGNLGPCGRRK